jgi:signal transduction histidine kinase
MSSVLIVDDSPADRALFRELLTRSGFLVDEVALGRAALDAARALLPHAIILDINLPDVDGFTLCREFRADPQFEGIPILMLTVRGRDADIVAGLDAGADDFVLKDAPREIIVARIRRLVRYRQLATVAALNEQLVQVGRLVAGIVHEIRGPLSVIRGNAEILRLETGEGHPLLERIDPIIRGCQHLQVRLEHLMAAVRSGPPIFERLDVCPVIREATELFQKGTDPRSSRVAIVAACAEDLPPVRADAGRLIQVLLNLMGNAHEAIMATRPEGRITVRAGRGRDAEADWVTIDVLDDGPGIPESHLPRIFEPFYTTKTGGSGYGLYLASQILREHDGRLTACNVEDGGACFTVWLPLADAPAPVE